MTSTEHDAHPGTSTSTGPAAATPACRTGTTAITFMTAPRHAGHDGN